MLTIISIFHNSESYIQNYFQQVKSLDTDNFYIFLEGNSTDDTYILLEKFISENKGILYKKDVEKVYGSIEHPQRFKQLSELWNMCLEAIPNESDYVLFVESDLIWSKKTFDYLYEQVQSLGFVAPCVIKPEHYFYDTWGFRYSKEERFSPELSLMPKEITKVYSAGSFLLMKASIARENKISPDNAVIGFCESAKEQLYVCPISVFHQ